ncbi:MAG: hypothetical protein R3E08_13570 [Thiotrichaceae bacterium]
MPVFANLFADFGADLPHLTQLIVQFSDLVQDYLLGILATLLILLDYFGSLVPNYNLFSHFWTSVLQASNRALSPYQCLQLLSNGASQNKAIESAALAMGISLQRIQHELAQNVTLSEALAKMSWRFPKSCYICRSGRKDQETR